MADRLELHSALKEILDSSNVYFQPPATVRMRYPAIVYNLEGGKEFDADNINYLFRRRYAVTVIDRDPDALWPEMMLRKFSYCNFERAYASDNLNHWQFSLYW